MYPWQQRLFALRAPLEIGQQALGLGKQQLRLRDAALIQGKVAQNGIGLWIVRNVGHRALQPVAHAGGHVGAGKQLGHHHRRRRQVGMLLGGCLQALQRAVEIPLIEQSDRVFHLLDLGS